MLLSIMVPVFNAEDTIAVQLRALALQEWSEPFEILIADNRCTDGTMKIVQEYVVRYPHMRVVDAHLRQGKSYALNFAVQQSRGQFLLFCDADDEVAPGWVAAMGNALFKHDLVASRFDMEKLNPPDAREARSNPQASGIQQYRKPPYLPHAGGGGLGVRRSILEEVQGFDERMRYLEDTDFCWRVQLKGYKLEFVPDAVVHVRLRTSPRGIFGQARNYGKYNVMIYARYRPYGMPDFEWNLNMGKYISLIKRFYRIRSRSNLCAWLWQTGYLYGRIQGSLKYRVLAF